MGKHTKLSPPAESDSLQAPPGKLQDQAAELMQRTISHLEKLLAAAERTLDAGEANPALARESAAVARAMVQVAAELRQREKHERLQVKDMTPDEQDELVAEYIKGLNVERRSVLRRRLDEIDRGEGVL